jgi:hypothetical protein
MVRGSKHQSLPIFTGFNVTSAQHPARVQDAEEGQDNDENLPEGQNLRTTMMVGVLSAPDRADIYRLPQNRRNSVTAAGRWATTVHARRKEHRHDKAPSARRGRIQINPAGRHRVEALSGVPSDDAIGRTGRGADQAWPLRHQGQSAVCYIGLGEQFDGDKVKAYPPGSRT